MFTILTVWFQPMSFVATLFTIPLKEWASGLTLEFVSPWIFGTGFAALLVVSLVVIAFFRPRSILDGMRTLVLVLREAKLAVSGRIWRKDIKEKNEKQLGNESST